MRKSRKVTTSIILPPDVRQVFDKGLLTHPVPDLRDRAADLYSLYHYVKDKLMKKTRNIPNRKAKCEALEKEFLELYGRAITKEEELKGQKKRRTEQPFYSFASIGGKDEEIYNRFRFKRRVWSYTTERKYSKI